MLARLRTRLGRFLTVGISGLVLSSPLWGQCAMCRESAKFVRQATIEALNQGILILAIPPLAIAVGIGVVTYRYRNGSQS
ncbi:MAG: hypothetical protein O2968_08925 [Acidobacteria bacterium]|nr:hypothetical protein [Acidobacteriota bacterium]